MKKIFLIIFIILFVAGLFVIAVDIVNKDSVGEEIPELRWVVPVSEQPDGERVIEEINKKLEEKLGVRLSLEFVEQKQYAAKMKMYMSSGDDFDLCFTGSWINSYENAVECNGLMDITDMLSDEMSEKLSGYLIKQATIDGRIYAVPNVQVMTHPCSLKIRKDLAEKYNLDVSGIKHINDIEAFLETIKNNEPEIIPYRVSWGEGPWVRPYYEEVYPGTLIYIKKDGSSTELVKGQETPEYQEALKKCSEWYQKGYMIKDVSNTRNDLLYEAEGKYAVQITSWKPGIEALEESNGREYIFVPLHVPYMERLGGLQTMTGVGINSKNPEKAVELIELMNTDKELYNLICHGIKGEHYNLTENNRIEAVNDSGYKPDKDWVFGNQFNSYIIKGAPEDVWEQTKKMDDESLKSPVVGFKPDTSEIKLELEQVKAVIDGCLYSDLFLSLVSGEDDYHEEFNMKLKEAGQDKVKEVLEQQVNEFLEGNK